MKNLEQQGEAARRAARVMMTASTGQKNEALAGMAQALLDGCADILAANREDLEAARQGGMSEAMLDRLALSEKRVQDMAEGIRQVQALPDPVGEIVEGSVRPNGLQVQKVRVPLGVIGMIYEARPNVTSDAAALCLKAGNVVIWRGGKEAIRSNTAIVSALSRGLEKAGLPAECVQLVGDTSRESATAMMRMSGVLDVLIPRGGAGLIKSVVENSRVPVIETGVGNCHIFVDETADLKQATDIVFNAKTSRPSVCNAAEVCLVHRAVAADFLPRLRTAVVDERTARGEVPVELRLDSTAAAIIPGTPAGERDFDTEFLDYILAVRVVDSLEDAVSHIACHSTGHSECIVTENAETAERFLACVDAAAVYHNASTRFTDGGEFGLGAEIGISTQKLHARGPLGLAELTSMKYIVRGAGQIR